MKTVPLVVVALVACGGDRDDIVQRPTPQGGARDAGAQVDATTELVGVITAAELVDISSRVAGIVKTVRVDVSDNVTKDQVVAEMDPTQLADEVRAAEGSYNAAGAALNAAKINVDAAEKKVVRETKAVADGVSPQVVLDEAREDLQRKKAALMQASSDAAVQNARLKTARDHLRDAELRAPFSGKVSTKYVTAGGRVEAGAPIVRIVGAATPRLKFAIPQGATGYEPGVTIRAEAGKTRVPVTATIKFKVPQIDAASEMIIVDAELAAGLDLAPGTEAWVHPL
jgi:RND family efflux transporter MFP subunit